MNNSNLCLARAVAVACLCWLTTACGGGIEPMVLTGNTLEGTVKYGGNPLPMALIVVEGPGGATQGEIGSDGRYRVENVPLGEVSIGVNTDAAKGQLQSMAMAAAMTKDKSKAPPKLIEVPAKYHSAAGSGIKTTVVKGANTFDIDIPK